jgi:biotin operon repressor
MFSRGGGDERQTAEALAAEFGVSVRTILRDVQALVEAGIPVLTERGKYGGISLLPGSQAEKWALALRYTWCQRCGCAQGLDQVTVTGE